VANPSQRDYGHEGSETPLVPGSLRLYRHFKSIRAELYPMNNTYGVNPYRRPDYLPMPDVYVAECRKASAGSANWAQQLVAERLRVPEHGESPARHCTCGFYAHYEPTTDFYPDHDWNLQGENTRLVVKGVVEGIGRVVMGTKGVRAQKLKIVALAPDWTKYRSTEWAERLENARTYDEYRSLRDNPAQYGPSYGELEKVRGVMVGLAQAYRVELFPDPDALHTAYPPQDVSELVDQPKKHPPTNLKDLSKRWMV
jgi:hypothetical protein